MSKSVIDEVFDKAGGRKALMQSLGVSKQTISDWVRQGHVSAHRAAEVEKLTGIARERLAPKFPWHGEKANG